MVSAGAVFSCYITVCFDSLFFFSQLQQEISVSGPVKYDLVSGFRSVFVAVVLLILFQLLLCLFVFLSAAVVGVVSVSSWKSCFCCLFCFFACFFLYLFLLI